MKIKFYYQIDFIDKSGLANYIDTFKQHEFDKAKEHFEILSKALSCTQKHEEKTKYVLDMYAYIESDDFSVDDTDILLAQLLPELELKL